MTIEKPKITTTVSEAYTSQASGCFDPMSLCIIGNNLFVGTCTPGTGVYGASINDVINGGRLKLITYYGRSINKVFKLKDNRLLISTDNDDLIKYTDDTLNIDWTQSIHVTLHSTNINESKSVTSVCITDSRIYATISEGLYYSEDNGETWTLVSNAYPFIVVYIKNGRMFCGTAGKGLVYSDDNGGTWTQKLNDKYINCNSRNDAVNIVSLASRLFIIEGLTNIWCSDDNGETWTQLHNNICKCINAICTIGERIVIAGRKTGSKGIIMYSDDNGTTFTEAQLPDIDFKCEVSDIIVVDQETILASVAGYQLNSNSYVSPFPGILLSNGITEIVPVPVHINRPLDKAGIQNLINQCKAYVQSKKQS